MVCKTTDLKGEVPQKRSIEDAMRQLAEFGVAPFKVMNKAHPIMTKSINTRPLW